MANEVRTDAVESRHMDSEHDSRDLSRPTKIPVERLTRRLDHMVPDPK